MTTNCTKRNGKAGGLSSAETIALEMPPHDADAELALIAAEVHQPGLLEHVGAVRSDFHTGIARELFDALRRMHEDGAPISVDTFFYKLKSTVDGGVSLWEQIGGEGTFRDIAERIAAPRNVLYYFDKVRESAIRRKGICQALAIARALQSQSNELSSVLDAADFSRLLETSRDRFKVLSSAELDSTELEIPYLVEGIIIRGQPCIVAGGKKTLKTNISIDLVMSLAHAGLFLGVFKVPRVVRVALLSGESGRATIAETARRIARAKQWSLENFSDALWGFDLPRLGEPGDLAALRSFIKERRIECIIIDPTYLALPLGDSAANLFEVGAKLTGLTRLGQETDCTIILVHHTRKNPADPFEPAELEDIAWAGFPEWARQWLLISRRKRYDAEQGGHHELWINIGGSAGHSGLWGFNIDEGTRQDEGGRRWDVEVLKPSEARAVSAASRDEEKERAKREGAEDIKGRIVRFLSTHPCGETRSAISGTIGRRRDRCNEVLDEMLDGGLIENCEFKKNRRTEYGFRLADVRSDPVGPGRTVGACPSVGGGGRTPGLFKSPGPTDRPTAAGDLHREESDASDRAGEEGG